MVIFTLFVPFLCLLYSEPLYSVKDAVYVVLPAIEFKKNAN